MRRQDASVARQRARLLELQGNSDVVRHRRRGLLEWLAARSKPRGPSPADGSHAPKGNTGKQRDECCCDTAPEQPGMELLENEAGGDPVPVVTGEVLASPEGDVSPPEALRAIQTFGFDGVEAVSVGNRADAILRFTASRAGSANISGAIDTLQRLGYTAGPNHFFPLAWSVKGKVGPEGTCGELEELGDRELSGIVVAVDTGLASDGARDRDDGRLALPAAAYDLDPLDQRDAAGNPNPDGCLDLGAGHGTSVAGVVEKADDCLTIHVLRAIGPDGVGDELRLASKIEEALAVIDRAGGRGVINLSLGTQTLNDLRPLGLGPIIEEIASRPGVCVVAAAGNSGTDQPVWPAAFESVIAVAGLGTDGQPAKWSSYGEWVTFSALAEGIVAPFVVGKETPGTDALDDPFDPYPDIWDGPNPNASWTGTSFAAPRVAAWLARYLDSYPKSSCDEACRALAERKVGSVEGFGDLLPDSFEPPGG